MKRIRPLFYRTRYLVPGEEVSIIQVSAEASIFAKYAVNGIDLVVRGPTENFSKSGIYEFSLGEVLEIPE